MDKKYTEVILDSINVWCISVNGGVKNSKDAFNKLESRLPTLRNRRFYGVLSGSPENGVYRACTLIKSDDIFDCFEKWNIPSGKYIKAKILDWGERVDQIGKTFGKMAEEFKVDETRPYIEFYRSQKELILFLPIK